MSQVSPAGILREGIEGAEEGTEECDVEHASAERNTEERSEEDYSVVEQLEGEQSIAEDSIASIVSEDSAIASSTSRVGGNNAHQLEGGASDCLSPEDHVASFSQRLPVSILIYLLMIPKPTASPYRSHPK